MNRYFRIEYAVVGSVDFTKTDNVSIWTNSISDAIKQFTEKEWDEGGYMIRYTEYAIKSIT